jgi:hypothetical protein
MAIVEAGTYVNPANVGSPASSVQQAASTIRHRSSKDVLKRLPTIEVRLGLDPSRPSILVKCF